MKVCFKCGTAQELSEFYRHSEMADGHLNKCKACAKKDVWNHRHGEGRARVLEYDRIRAANPERLERAKAIGKQWRENHPDRRKANIEVANAIRSGALVKHPCFVCGSKAEAHHPDYSRPLDVMWLCSEHHKQAHALVTSAASYYLTKPF